MTTYIDPRRDLSWPICWAAVQEIARSEGLRLNAYRCPAGVPTIGRGETDGVKMGDVWTLEEADRRFVESLQKFTAGVQQLLTRDASANELGAMVSLAYNIGLGGFERSTVRRMHNAGDFNASARAFALWNQAGGHVLAGLTARRAREAAMYLTPDDNAEPRMMPQAVEAESSLTKSPIAQSGLISVIGGVGALLSSVTQPIREFADGLGLDPLLVIGGVAVVVGVIVMDQRRKQRDGGWT